MAVGWAKDNAVQEQIDASVADAVAEARARLPAGPSRSHCENCDTPIPRARQTALPGVRLCLTCQKEADRHQQHHALYNRRGSKDSQLR